MPPIQLTTIMNTVPNNSLVSPQFSLTWHRMIGFMWSAEREINQLVGHFFTLLYR